MFEKIPTALSSDEVAAAEKMMTKAMKETNKEREIILERRKSLPEIKDLRTRKEGEIVYYSFEAGGHFISLAATEKDGEIESVMGEVDNIELTLEEANKIYQKYEGLDWEAHNRKSEKKVEGSERKEMIEDIMKDLGI